MPEPIRTALLPLLLKVKLMRSGLTEPSVKLIGNWVLLMKLLSLMLAAPPDKPRRPSLRLLRTVLWVRAIVA